MKLVEIYHGTWVQCQMAKRLLECVEIKATLKDPNLGTACSFSHPRSNIKLMVEDEDYESATHIVTKLEL